MAQGRPPAKRLSVPKELVSVNRNAAPELNLTPSKLRRGAVATASAKGKGGKNKRGQDCRWGVTPGGWCALAPIRPETTIVIHRDERGRPLGTSPSGGSGGAPTGGVAGRPLAPVPSGSIGTTALNLVKEWGPLAASFTPWGRIFKAGRAVVAGARAAKAARALTAGKRITDAAKLLPRFIPK